jgi:hypothetical protein
MDYRRLATNVGEVLLKYFVNSDDSISFEVNQTLLYQKKRFQNLEPFFFLQPVLKSAKSVAIFHDQWVFFVNRFYS